MALEDLRDRQFGYVVPPVCHCYPTLPPPPPAPPGISMQDWMTYINAYIDVRARQMYEKLKQLIPSDGGQGGGTPSSGVQSVVYSNVGNNQRIIGNIVVDGVSTPIKIPNDEKGVETVTYEPKSNLGNNLKTIGTLNVDGTTTEIKIPNVDVDVNINAVSPQTLNNPKKVCTIENVDIYCESPNGAVLDSVILKDKVTGEKYSLYMENGRLESNKIN